MSTIKIATIICWIITAVVLVGLVIWFLTGSIFGAWNDGMGNWGIGFNSFENLTGPFDADGTYSVESAGVDSIKIDWVAGEVSIKPHDGNDIRLVEYAQRELRDNEKLRYTTSGSTLEIRYTERSIRGRIPRKQLEVLVPRELSGNMHSLSIATVSGGVNVNDISASILNCEAVSGDLRLSGTFNDVDINSISGRITLENSAKNTVLNVESVSGRMDLSGDFQRVDVDTVSGSVTVTSTVTPSSLSANSVSGDFAIIIPDEASISVNHSSVSGRLSSDIPVTMESRGAQFEISTVSGSTNIHALDS